MQHIDFRTKINWRRPIRSPDAPQNEYEILRIFESDRGRIINSAAIRRLQHKTQVFPLERNAAVRTRLTHSMEVQQAGRYIAKEVISQLAANDKLTEYGLNGLTAPFESIVEMACLMHDIGNPPFGHFGEAAINDWFKKHLCPEISSEILPESDGCQAGPLRFTHDTVVLNALRSDMRQDLCQFDGNAQGIRLVHSLLRMNLTWAQVGCILKYTRPAWFTGDVPEERRYLMKKPGFYLSESAYIFRLREALELDEFSRFPLTWIMEAADDISYCIADLEDAVEKRIFTGEELYHHLYRAWPQHNDEDLFAQVIEMAWQKARVNTAGHSTVDLFFMYLRVNTMNQLVPYAARRFIDHLPQIYSGAFNQALLEDESASAQLLGLFKQVAIQYVFRDPEVEQLELQGYRVITGLLDIYSPLLTLTEDQFAILVREDRLLNYPIETRLFHKLSIKHKVAYMESIDKLTATAPEFTAWEYYYRGRLIQDYISGMTDLYAWDEYRRLMAVE